MPKAITAFSADLNGKVPAAGSFDSLGIYTFVGAFLDKDNESRLMTRLARYL